MGLPVAWPDFLTRYANLDEGTFLARVKTPYLLVLPDGTSLEDSSMGVETLVGLTETKANALAKPKLFRYAIPLEKGDSANPFAHMVTIGRAVNNDLILKSKQVSKFHAYFRLLGEAWSVHDANSSNGTYVNGVRLPSERSRTVKSGDQVSFGKEITTIFLCPLELHELLSEVEV